MWWGFLLLLLLVPASVATPLGWAFLTDFKADFPAFGPKGEFSALSKPNLRGHNMALDSEGNLFFFFGMSQFGTLDTTRYYNAVWKSAPASQHSLWMWFSGSNLYNAGTNVRNAPSVWGTKGVFSSNAMPGARTFGAVRFDGQFFWAFGGQPPVVGPELRLGDLWALDPFTGHWAWQGGTQDSNALGVYPTFKGTSATARPGPRYGHILVADGLGSLWVGFGIGPGASSSVGHLNDFWHYSDTTKQWTWWAGASGVDTPGSYGTREVEAEANVPSFRAYTAHTVDKSGIIWVFGGGGLHHNDLWRFRIASKRWTWMSGTSLTDRNGVYGTKNVASLSNYPGGRRFSSMIAMPDDSLLTGFGIGMPETGTTFSSLNDQWRWKFGEGWTWIGGSKQVGASGQRGKDLWAQDRIVTLNFKIVFAG